MKKKVSIILACIIAACAVSMAGCSKQDSSSQPEQNSQSGSSKTENISAVDLLDGIELADIEGAVYDEEYSPQYNNFSVSLAQKCNKQGGNFVVSPISVIYAVTMAANGADGETLSRIETALDADLYTLNRYLYFAMEGEYGNDPTKQSRANALWINNASGYKPDGEYLQNVRTFFDANLYSADFEKAKDEINTWMSAKTNGKITNAVDSVSTDETMLLANSLVFEAQWLAPFEAGNIKQDTFTGADGASKQVDFLNSTESYTIGDDKAQGFVKRYKAENYAFAALVPGEGVSVDDYLNELTGEKLTSLLSGAKEEKVAVNMPKFEQSDTLSLKDALGEMGITDAFDNSKADFSKMGTSDKKLSLTDEINCEYISVDERGVNFTGAIAADESGASNEAADKAVSLNRPFIYIIYDRISNTPKFIGVIKTL